MASSKLEGYRNAIQYANWMEERGLLEGLADQVEALSAHAARLVSIEKALIADRRLATDDARALSLPYRLWGLAGNAWEWQANYYRREHDYLALRGGSWRDHLEYARVAVRSFDLPDLHWSYNGLRVVALPNDDFVP